MPTSLFTNIQQVRDCIPTGADLSLESIQGYLVRAEVQLVVPAIGQATLDQIKEADKDDGRGLAQVLRPAVAAYAFFLLAGTGQRTLTANGSEALNGAKENANTDKLTQNHLTALQADAEAQLEQVLAGLEADSETYETWHRSPLCTLFPGHFFASSEELQAYALTPVTRRRFRALRAAINAAELRYLRPVLGPSLVQRLLDERDEEMHRDVLNLARTGLAGYALNNDAQIATSDQALVELRWLLQRSPDQYPEFPADSPAYVPTEPAPDTSTNNFFSGI